MMTRNLIYADNAATTPMSDAAIKAMMQYLADDFGNVSQPYTFSRKPKKALTEAREIIAACIGAKPAEIIFTSGGTESDNWSLINAWRHGRKIVTSAIEHHAILNSCHFIENQGGKIDYLPVDGNGFINTQLIKNALEPQGFLSIMMANNEIGTIEPLSQYSLLAKEQEAIFHTDAVQAVGHIPINVNELGVDMLSASAHKFNGPKGIGFLYVREGTSIKPFINGGSQEFGLRAGTENVAAIIAMAIALRENVDNIESNANLLYELESSLLENLKFHGVKFTRNGNNQLPGSLSLSFEDKDGEALLHRLDLMGIAVSSGSACDSKNTNISHVLQAIALPESLARGTIRITFGKQNTKEDAKAIASAIAKIIL